MMATSLSTLLELSPLPMMAIDPKGFIAQANSPAASILGYPADQLPGQALSQLLSGIADAAADGKLGNELRFPHELCITKQDGMQGFIEITQKPLAMEGTLASIVIFTDITAQRTAEIALRDIQSEIQRQLKNQAQQDTVKTERAASEQSSLHGAFHNAPIGMMLVDLDWQITRVNRSVCEMLGYSAEDLLKKEFQEITHPDDISSDLDLVRQMISGGINDYRLEKRYLHKDGHVIWMLLSVSLLKDSNDIPVHFIFHILDITEYKKVQQQISEYAYQDALTNLPNRRLLQDRLKHALVHAKRYKRSMGIMFLDIDHFKTINDTYGHAFGDELIKHVADSLSECVRSSDTVCRLGGDEFVIVVSEITGQQDLALIAEKILKCVSKPILIEGHEAKVTISIGVVLYNTESEDTADGLMKKADQALYEMKREGRDGFRVFNA